MNENQESYPVPYFIKVVVQSGAALLTMIFCVGFVIKAIKRFTAPPIFHDIYSV